MDPLTVPGTVESLKPIRDYVAAAGQEAGLPQRTVSGLCLAVDEIATNAILHGYEESNMSGEVVVRADIDNETLTITLEDDGAYYDPTQHNIPTEEELAQPLEMRNIGGLGIYIVLQRVDDFRYEHIAGHNRNIFIMRR